MEQEHEGGDHVSPSCPNCDGQPPADRWHVRKDLPVALSGTLVVIAMAMGSWVWYLSGQSAAVAAVDHRVTAIEEADRVRDNQIATMSDRLARMEPMLQFLVTQLQKSNR